MHEGNSLVFLRENNFLVVGRCLYFHQTECSAGARTGASLWAERRWDRSGKAHTTEPQPVGGCGGDGEGGAKIMGRRRKNNET